jgi:SMI1-KNR4 cell-wall
MSRRIRPQVSAPGAKLYLLANGGIPEPYVFEDENLDTVVTEFLPLKSENANTAITCYRDLVLDKKSVPRYFFPFAVDGGGDYFFVDTATPEGAIYFYRHDNASSKPLLNLKVGFERFWALLKDET